MEAVDPLDAFMETVATEIKNQPVSCVEKPSILNQDNDEEMVRVHENIQDEVERDDLKIEVLQPLEHDKIVYERFRKNFYVRKIAAEKEFGAKWREEQKIKLSVNGDLYPPATSFLDVALDRVILDTLSTVHMSKPTAIQAQVFPIALSGKDVIGIAKTGSGKTFAYVVPMMVHVMDQREIEKGEGPIAMILSPTRELAHQIYTQTRKFTKPYGANCAAVYGGGGKWEQVVAVKKGVEIVIATPGRLIDMIKKNVLKMNRITFLVLDEADKMFDMGFEPQIRSIVGQIRKDRQTLLFSATFRKKVESLARDILCDPIRITVGDFGAANKDIRQIAIVLENDQAKWKWMQSKVHEFEMEGKTLVFATSKAGCDALSESIASMGFQVGTIHGDKSQNDRSLALNSFRKGTTKYLIATDVAARGLDIKDIRFVVNYDVPKNIETHIHRIGRTGRIGNLGTAYTLVTPNDYEFAGSLVNNFDRSEQVFPNALLMLAEQDHRFTRKQPNLNNIQGSEEPSQRDAYSSTTSKQTTGLGFHGKDSGTHFKTKPMMMNFVKSTKQNEAPPPPRKIEESSDSDDSPVIAVPNHVSKFETPKFDLAMIVSKINARHADSKPARKKKPRRSVSSESSSSYSSSSSSSSSSTQSRSKNRPRNHSSRYRRRHRSRSSSRRRSRSPPRSYHSSRRASRSPRRRSHDRRRYSRSRSRRRSRR